MTIEFRHAITKEHRLAKAWYIKYPLDAYAMGPYRFQELVPATVATEQAKDQFGELPREVWPDGNDIEEIEEYDVRLRVPYDPDDPEENYEWEEDLDDDEGELGEDGIDDDDDDLEDDYTEEDLEDDLDELEDEDDDYDDDDDDWDEDDYDWDDDDDDEEEW